MRREKSQKNLKIKRVLPFGDFLSIYNYYKSKGCKVENMYRMSFRVNGEYYYGDAGPFLLHSTKENLLFLGVSLPSFLLFLFVLEKVNQDLILVIFLLFLPLVFNLLNLWAIFTIKMSHRFKISL